MNIIPAILPKNRNELITSLQRLVDAGYSGRVQIDLCDGIFVESVTWPLQKTWREFFGKRRNFFALAEKIETDSELQSLLKNFTIDVDLMIRDVEDYFEVYESLQADRIIIHLSNVDTDYKKETYSLWLAPNSGPYDFLHKDQTVLAFKLDTPIELFRYWYEKIGIRNVQVMGIETIGKQGESFSEKTFDYIKQLQIQFPGISIMVDGGVGLQNVAKLAEIGVVDAVAGSAVFRGDVAENIAHLQKSAIL